ncbi:MAG: phenylalanine--tRNA ligase subunit alpha [Candidatus Peribacteraceae bacterium]|nr:phenylalanine--tRNA ligase subunit alpha [Candidatus Peribacteraceae bacterium]MDD5739369.1 phenylalanine--tRNA ligase subunit alpha [Candidatus Peribacteraceae bacterium]
MTDPHADWESFDARIRAAKTADELAAVEQELFGRKAGVMTLALKSLHDVAAEERKSAAAGLNAWKRTFDDLITLRRKEFSSPSDETLRTADRIDVTLELPQRERGHLHLIPEFIREVEEVFGRLGFDVATGPEIETEEFNFNQLNIPRDHPARDAQDTFWLKTKNPEDRLLLRTQTSPMQIRYMQSHKPPLRVIAPGKVYRKDSDATHSPMFHQFEGLMIGEDVTLANMKAVMIEAIRTLVSPTAEFRFRTGFFPFVEPGLEVDMRWQGDEEDSREGKWLEIVGCGMVHPNVLRNCGIDPKKYQGFAFGFGVERMIMIKHQIPDLRAFFIGDLRFLRQF